MTWRARLVVLATAIGSVLIAAPGVHAFELSMSPVAATIVSHGLAVLGLALSVWLWRRARRSSR